MSTAYNTKTAVLSYWRFCCGKMSVIHGSTLPGHVVGETFGYGRCQSFIPRVVSLRIKSPARVALVHANRGSKCMSFAPHSSRRTGKLVRKYKPNPIICLLGGKDRPKDESKESPWNSIGKVFENLGGRSVEDVLREQIQNQKYYDSGIGGKKPPYGGSGGKGGSGSGESENGSNAEFLNEAVQVILATMGFLIMYIYIICGPELTRLLRDYIKFLNGGGQSVRLKKALRWWRTIYNFLTRRRKMDDTWLENEIMNTTTWFDHPEKMQTN